ncbi:fanconi-associated nuclease 1 [Lepeophtheirus salmonis]|uniref:fanconi-associated nuclease 1 n=1 Tax=Lepeophtheirus salmonis TaxID=72036 RepID=UPI001AE947E4|nr:fanconi-associated nuclease 1-like [Lepeophtheirus salmonis]XP_040566023.1 fanconi-associated nuclease 1-like [Lepeophtheirus salmonis]XP_040566024.1 fanconi-associated nuclease 1-like [Lepeophtheirus salmonis]XP_040566025.1 fanconi-associated nuclease 1-like [Lepeophtheirus salmonis]
MSSKLQTHASCPVCNKKVLLIKINNHLDNGECKSNLSLELFPSDDVLFGKKVDEEDDKVSSRFLSHFKRTKSSSESEILPNSLPPTKRSKQIEESMRDERVKPYYLANWETIVRGVLEECPDDANLFTVDEISLATKCFKSLSYDAQKLYVRLFQRKWTWISIKKMSYAEIVNVENTLKELEEHFFINDHSSLKDISLIINLLPSPEVKKLCKSFNINKSTKKDIILAFDKLIKQKSFFNKCGVNEVLQNKIIKKALDSLDPCFILSEEPRRLFNRILSLHSLTRFYEDRDNNNAGNSNLTVMLLANRGDLLFPIYEISRKQSVFRSREGLLAYETALNFEAKISELSEIKEFREICDNIYPELRDHFKTEILGKFSKEDAELPDFLRKFTAGGIIVYCFSKCAEAFEKVRNYEAAVSIYKYCLSKEQVYNKELSSGHWFERLTLDLEQWLKRREEAFFYAKEALENQHISPARKLTLCQRIVKMRKHLKEDLKNYHLQGWIDPTKCDELLRNVEIQGSMLDKDLSGNNKSVFIFDTGEQDREKLYCSVEEFTIKYYQNEYPMGVHGEGSVINSIVFVLFWDVVYDCLVSDAFRGPYQSSPLDIGSLTFYESRKKIIESRLESILKESYEKLHALLEKNWKLGQGTSSLVNWDLFSDFSSFKELIDCFTKEQLCEISRRLLTRHRFFRSGFPDLTLWNPEKKSVRFVEVKGPGDRLSTKQIIWLNFLNSIGLDAIVCYVQAIGSKSLH